jgi:hypothetical protein
MRYLRRAIVIETGVQNILNFEIFLVIFDVQCGRGRRETRRERSRANGIEERNMVDIMDMSHSGRQGELVGL